MNIGTPFIWAIILALLSPVIWVAWWLLADLVTWANGSHSDVYGSAERSHRWAA
jgi:hypothetical protein